MGKPFEPPRSTSRNGKVYAAITAELNTGLPPDFKPFAPKQVRMKIDRVGASLILNRRLKT